MSRRNILVLGGAGGLGSGIISHFNKLSSSCSWNTINVDFKNNEEGMQSIVLNPSDSMQKNIQQIQKQMDGTKVDSIVCAAGGWAGGDIGSDDAASSLEQMWSMNVQSAVVAAHLSTRLLNNEGLLVLTGALAALKDTPDMFAYGMSKAATHHLIASISSKLPPKCSVVGILPVTIDTPTNRQFMQDADWSSWTKPDEIARKLEEWSTDFTKRPVSGDLQSVLTEDNITTWKSVGNPFLG